MYKNLRSKDEIGNVFAALFRNKLKLYVDRLGTLSERPNTVRVNQTPNQSRELQYMHTLSRSEIV